MHKKVGPLQSWQWLLIIGGSGLLYLLYEHQKNTAAAASTTTSTGADTGTGAIDPTTGLPYATEGGSVGASPTDSSAGTSTNSGNTLTGELSDLSAIEQLMAGLQGFPDLGQTATLNADLSSLNKTLGKQATALTKLQNTINKKKAPAKKKPPKKTVTHGGTKNPGHKITTHPHGAKSASSSAPHNARQHTNVAPPSHQRAHRKVHHH